MRRFFLSMIAIAVSIVSYAQTPTDSLVRATAIVDGLFFDQTTPAKSITPGGCTMAILKDPDGKTVLGVYLPQGYVLDDEIMSHAIPYDKVMYAERLLRDYNGRKPATTAQYQGIGVTVGEPMIDFNYTDTDNEIWNNEVLRGKPYVINVWQSECGPCRGEMPILSQWKERFPGVVFLSASRHNAAEIQPIVQRHNFTWNHLQEATDIVALVRQEGFPLTIVVDKNGIVRFAKVGASEANQNAALTIIEELAK